jgi:hypothetical protein
MLSSHHNNGYIVLLLCYILKGFNSAEMYFPDAGVINKKTKYGWNNITNTVINVPDILLHKCLVPWSIFIDISFHS